MGGAASPEVVHRVFRHNPDSFWAIARRDHFMAGLGGGEGFVAYLMLNQAGVDSLFNGSFSALDPDLSFICRQSETPVAIYVWGILARGLLPEEFHSRMKKSARRDIAIFRSIPALRLRKDAALLKVWALSGGELSGAGFFRICIPSSVEGHHVHLSLSMTLMRQMVPAMRSELLSRVRSKISFASCPFGAQSTSPSRNVPMQRNLMATT